MAVFALGLPGAAAMFAKDPTSNRGTHPLLFRFSQDLLPRLLLSGVDYTMLYYPIQFCLLMVLSW